jgi:hypothetical protein
MAFGVLATFDLEIPILYCTLKYEKSFDICINVYD